MGNRGFHRSEGSEVTSIEFPWKGRRMRVDYDPNGRIELLEYIEDRFDRKYWRRVPNRARTRNLYRELVFGRTKKDFRNMNDIQKRVRHKKGGEYEVIGQGRIQTSTPLNDMDQVVVYRSIEDGSIWARRALEFYDGRFEDIE